MPRPQRKRGVDPDTRTRVSEEDWTPADADYAKRMRSIRAPPEAISGDAADKWTAEAVTNVQPKALAEQMWQLKYGSPSERASASRFLLSIGGHAPNDAKVKGGGSTGPVVVLVGPGIGALSWGPKLVEGTVTATALPADATPKE